MTESDWQHKGDKENEKNGLTIQESMTLRGWQHKILRPQEWQRLNQEKGLTEQETMTETEWQHKIETTKVTEN